MYSEKVLLVDEDILRRISCKTVLQSAGYHVADYGDPANALSAVANDGREPLVWVGAPGEDPYTARTVRKCLDFHTERTGVNYGQVTYDMPGKEAARELLTQGRITCPSGEDLAGAVKTEFERIRRMPPPPQGAEMALAANY